MFKRILVPIDGSPTSNQGFKLALGLAKEQVAKLYVLHVVDEMVVARGLAASAYGPPDYFDTLIGDLREAGRKILAKAEGVASKRGHDVQSILVETLGQSVAQTILAQARKVRADLIVLGTHGRRGLSRVVMGSDAEAVLRDARVPVLLVRSPATPHASAQAMRRTTRVSRGRGRTRYASVERTQQLRA